MSKLKFYFIFCLSILLFFKFPNTVFAADPNPICELTTEPATIEIPNDKINPDGPIEYKIKVADRGPNDKYDVILQTGGWFDSGFMGWRNTQPDSSGTLKDNGRSLIKTVSDFGGRDIFKEGTHQVIIQRDGGDYCPPRTYFIGKQTPPNQNITCSIFAPEHPNSATDITLTGTITPAGTYQFYIPNAPNKIFPISLNTDNTFSKSIGILNPTTDFQNSYQILLRAEQDTTDSDSNHIRGFVDTNCLIRNLTVESTATNPHPDLTKTIQIGAGQKGGGLVTAAKFCTDQAINDGKCSTGGGKTLPGCGTPTSPGIITAIGCIETSPTGFIKNTLTFVIGISGSLAFLMMLLGAFQMLTSAGNPETLNAGRERLTSATIGLLFVIFAVLLLQIIGLGILNIPGFR